MAGHVADQAANVAPPRRGAVIALTVDSTVRAYDLSTLALGGFTPNNANSQQEFVFLTLQAETADVFFYFADGATAGAVDDVDDTAAVAAGGTLAFANTYAARLVADQSMECRINRKVDKWLVVKAASTSGVLRLWASSEGF